MRNSNCCRPHRENEREHNAAEARAHGGGYLYLLSLNLLEQLLHRHNLHLDPPHTHHVPLQKLHDLPPTDKLSIGDNRLSAQRKKPDALSAIWSAARRPLALHSTLRIARQRHAGQLTSRPATSRKQQPHTSRIVQLKNQTYYNNNNNAGTRSSEGQKAAQFVPEVTMRNGEQ